MVHRTRLGAKISLQMHILPNFVYGFGSRRRIRDIKHLFDDLKHDEEEFAKADAEVNITKVLKAIDSFYQHSIQMEDDLATADEDVFVLEYRGLSILKKFHDHFDAIMRNSKLSPGLRSRMTDLASKYKKMISEIQPDLANATQQIRREKLDRSMLKDFMIQELIAMYFQMRMRVRDLRKKEGKLNSEEHRIVAELEDLLKKPNEKVLTKALDEFEHKFAPAIAAVVADAVFVERMITRLRHRLLDATDAENEHLKKLVQDGFPMAEIDRINKEVVQKFERNVHDDVIDEYEDARSMIHIVDEAAVIKEAA